MKKDWSQARWVALLPLLAVVLLYLTGGAMRNSIFFCKGGFCSESKSIPANIWKVIRADAEVVRPANIWKVIRADAEVVGPATISEDPTALNLAERKKTALRFNGRMGWSSLAEIYLFICMAGFAVAAILTFQLFPRRRWIWMLGILLASSFVGLTAYTNPNWHMPVFLIFFLKSITPDLPAIKDATNLLNSLGNAATFALLLTICEVLLPTPLDPYPAGLKQLSQKMKSLRTILYAGTLLLVVTMLLKNSTFQWALAYTSQEDAELGIARSLIAGFLNMDGTFYTLLLVVAYLPAWFVLQRRARLLADLPVEEVELEKKLQDYGMSFSFVKSIPRVLAIIAPFLAGPVGDLINNILF